MNRCIQLYGHLTVLLKCFCTYGLALNKETLKDEFSHVNASCSLPFPCVGFIGESDKKFVMAGLLCVFMFLNNADN